MDVAGSQSYNCTGGAEALDYSSMNSKQNIFLIHRKLTKDRKSTCTMKQHVPCFYSINIAVTCSRTDSTGYNIQNCPSHPTSLSCVFSLATHSGPPTPLPPPPNYAAARLSFAQNKNTIKQQIRTPWYSRRTIATEPGHSADTCQQTNARVLSIYLTFWRRNYFFNFSTPCI